MAPSPSNTSPAKKPPVTRLPMSRPCWSGNTTRTVSRSPRSIISRAVFRSSIPVPIVAPLRPRNGRGGPQPAASLARLPCPSDAFQVRLDGGQLFCGALHLGSLEPLPRRDQVPAAGQDDDRPHRDRRVVQRVDLVDPQAAR